jgi:hypothetical protein
MELTLAIPIKNGLKKFDAFAYFLADGKADDDEFAASNLVTPWKVLGRLH